MSTLSKTIVIIILGVSVVGLARAARLSPRLLGWFRAKVPAAAASPHDALHPHPRGGGVIAAFGGRVTSAVRLRAGRFRLALLVFVLLLPLLLTSLFGER